MRQSYVHPQPGAGTHGHIADVGENYPLSAQYKGDGWYVFNAATNKYGPIKYETAAQAERACAAVKEIAYAQAQ